MELKFVKCSMDSMDVAYPFSGINTNQVGLVVYEVLKENRFEIYFVLLFVWLNVDNIKSLLLTMTLSLESILAHFVLCEFFFVLFFSIFSFSTCVSLRLVGWLFGVCLCCVYFDFFHSYLLFFFSLFFYIFVGFRFVPRFVCLFNSCFFVFGNFASFIVVYVFVLMKLWAMGNKWIEAFWFSIVVLVGWVVLFLVQDFVTSPLFCMNLFSIVPHGYCCHLLSQRQHLFQKG